MRQAAGNRKTNHKPLIPYVGFAFLLMLVSVVGSSFLIMGCSVGALLYALIQLRLVFILNGDEADQRKKCRPLGGLLILPALCIVASAVQFVLQPQTDMPAAISYGMIGIAAAMLVCLLAHVFALRKNPAVAARFIRQTNCAAMSAPASLLVSHILLRTLEDGEEIATLVCLSVAVFGGMALLIAVNLTAVSLCGYQSTRNSVRSISSYVKGKRLTISRAAVIKDAVLVIGKAAISMISASFFMFANALYSVGIGVARFTAIRMHNQNRDDQPRTYCQVGVIILFSSFCYVLYSVRLFFGGSSGSYPMTIALMIACYTFGEFGINIREAIRLRKSQALEAKALRAVSFSSTLLCFVLTQTAIMSFANEGDNSFSNALSGVVFGGAAMLVGVYVIANSRIMKIKHNQTTGSE